MTHAGSSLIVVLQISILLIVTLFYISFPSETQHYMAYFFCSNVLVFQMS